MKSIRNYTKNIIKDRYKEIDINMSRLEFKLDNIKSNISGRINENLKKITDLECKADVDSTGISDLSEEFTNEINTIKSGFSLSKHSLDSKLEDINKKIESYDSAIHRGITHSLEGINLDIAKMRSDINNLSNDCYRNKYNMKTLEIICIINSVLSLSTVGYLIYKALI